MATLLGIGAQQNAIHVINNHKHTVWEIVYYTEGCGVITTDETQRDFHPGMIMCNKKVYEIAGLSGFSDPFYFTRVFKKVMGKSPSEWKHD